MEPIEFKNGYWRRPDGSIASKTQVLKKLEKEGFRLGDKRRITPKRNIATLKNLGAIKEVGTCKDCEQKFYTSSDFQDHREEKPDHFTIEVI